MTRVVICAAQHEEEWGIRLCCSCRLAAVSTAVAAAEAEAEAATRTARVELWYTCGAQSKEQRAAHGSLLTKLKLASPKARARLGMTAGLPNAL